MPPNHKSFRIESRDHLCKVILCDKGRSKRFKISSAQLVMRSCSASESSEELWRQAPTFSKLVNSSFPSVSANALASLSETLEKAVYLMGNSSNREKFLFSAKLVKVNFTCSS